MKSIRGAIAVVENNEESIMSSSKKLINEILINNAINENDIEFVIFTVTSDITEAFPAKAFRDLWSEKAFNIYFIMINIRKMDIHKET